MSATVDRDTLIKYMNIFKERVEADHDGRFDTPLNQKEEGYKVDVASNAINALDLDTWEDPVRDQERIMKCVTAAISKQVNLVDYHSEVALLNRIKKFPVEASRILYSFFKETDGQKSFDEIVKLTGRKYDLVAYMFFIKDHERYMPIRPSIFDKIFQKLSIDYKTFRCCSWSNYRGYLEILRSVRNEMEEYYCHDKNYNLKITLLDAHSFLWTIGHLDNNDTVSKKEIDHRELLSASEEENSPRENIGIKAGREGKRRIVYTTKYERDQKLRRIAIQIHGTKCMVCNFDFEATYGELGKDFIEVHHIKPLYEDQEERLVDPKADLVCLCSNCHSMIHRRSDRVLTPDELKKIINSNSSKSATGN